MAFFTTEGYFLPQVNREKIIKVFTKCKSCMFSLQPIFISMQWFFSLRTLLLWNSHEHIFYQQELETLLKDDILKRKYQQKLTIFIVGYQSICSERVDLLSQLSEVHFVFILSKVHNITLLNCFFPVFCNLLCAINWWRWKSSVIVWQQRGSLKLQCSRCLGIHDWDSQPPEWS